MELSDNKLHVVVDGSPILEFDRSKPIPGKQRQYLDQMDLKMDQGIQLGEEFLDKPNTLQRSQYIANSLINALFKEDYNLAIAMCTYLGKRIPELQQVKALSDNGKFSIELVFDRSLEESRQEQTISFYKPESNKETKH